MLFAACSGEAGPEGPQGPQGPQGPEGQVGSAGRGGLMLGWADATGTVIPGIWGEPSADGSSPHYIDPSTGYMWRVMNDNGLLGAEYGQRVWLSTDCSGTPLFQGWLLATGGGLRLVPPRVVFAIGSEFRVRVDDAVITGSITNFGSTDDIGSCNTSVNPGYAFTDAQTAVVAKPTLTFPGPMHPVLTTL
ncbi:MAG TPA: hypothetical protein VLB44_16940 [Kofleriaceae bacterium]|nr:hypothetical protein [Kofleriaceae bacterium]